MFTKSYTSLRQQFVCVLTLLLVCGTLSKGAEAQTSAPPVTGSITTSLVAPSGLGTVVQTALDNYGDWLVLDYVNGALYEYPAGASTATTLAAVGTFGGYANPGITFDSANDLLIAGNFNNCLLLFPYDTTTKTWDGLGTLNTTTNTGPDQCGTAPFSFAEYSLITPVGAETVNYIQPWGLATLPGNVLAVGSQDGPNFIFTLPIIPGPTPAGDCASDKNCSPYDTPGTADANAATLILLSMKKRPNSVAADKFGNIYFVEDSGGLQGAYMIPAGQTQVPSDTSSVITRVDPQLANVTAVATDSNGNLYISDSVAGVVLVPNPAGTPNPAAAVSLTTVPAVGQVSVDLGRGILYVPTSNGGLAKVTFSGQLGSTAAGTPAATSQAVQFTFSASETPAAFVVQEAGATATDFTVATDGTCTAGTAYTAGTGCTVNVNLNPHSAGSVSAKLAVLDSANNVLGSIVLQGVGTGSAVQVSPGAETAIGAGLKTPTQVAVDAAGNTYVADPGLGAVLMYPKGYGQMAAVTTVGTGLTAPSGVAVDGAGDVFIADSGNVIEVPEGSAGLNTAGQITVKTGLGSNLNLAIDGSGNLYIADPTNSRVVRLGNAGGSFGLLGATETDLTTGFSAPSAVAVDQSGNLYVADGANLIEVATDGTQTTLLSTLSGATGLAVDPSGAVYVAMAGGTVRIPNEGGTLTPADQMAVSAQVAMPTSVAIDASDDVFITDAAAEDVDFISASASTDFGALTSTTGTQSANYTFTNVGNMPLNVTGFSSTPDYSETATTCVGAAVAIGSNCTATLTFNPGPGDQGALSTTVLLQSDAANAPVGVNVTGTGAALAASTTTVTVQNATVNSAPVVITVAPSSGTGPAPTGQVTLTISGSALTTPLVVNGTLANGAVTLNETQIPAGMYTFAVAYQGDRTYGTSSSSAQVTIAVGAVALIQPSTADVQAANADPNYPLVLADGTGNFEPYDGSIDAYEYTYPVSIIPADNGSLVGQPVYNAKGVVVAMNYGTVTYQLQETAPTPGASVAASLCAPVPVAADGTAPLATSCLPLDVSNTSLPNLETTYTITPMYSPAGTGASAGNTNPNYAPVTGNPITFTAVSNPVVQISSSSDALAVPTGSSATADLTLTSLFGYGYAGGGGAAATATVNEPQGSLLNNYSFPVQLVCDGLPAYASCSFTYDRPDFSDPNSTAVGPTSGSTIPGTSNMCVNIGCVGPATVHMTVTTNVPTGVVASLDHRSQKVEFAVMFGLGLFGFAFGKKRALSARLLTLACLLLCSGVVAGVSGCSTKQFGTSTTTATPGGTYAVLVTARQVGTRTVISGGVLTTIYGSGHQVSLPYTINVTIQ